MRAGEERRLWQLAECCFDHRDPELLAQRGSGGARVFGLAWVWVSVRPVAATRCWRVGGWVPRRPSGAVGGAWRRPLPAGCPGRPPRPLRLGWRARGVFFGCLCALARAAGWSRLDATVSVLGSRGRFFHASTVVLLPAAVCLLYGTCCVRWAFQSRASDGAVQSYSRSSSFYGRRGRGGYRPAVRFARVLWLVWAPCYVWLAESFVWSELCSCISPARRQCSKPPGVALFQRLPLSDAGELGRAAVVAPTSHGASPLCRTSLVSPTGRSRCTAALLCARDGIGLRSSSWIYLPTGPAPPRASQSAALCFLRAHLLLLLRQSALDAPSMPLRSSDDALRLLKIARRISVRRSVSLASGFPFEAVFQQAYRASRFSPLWVG